MLQARSDPAAVRDLLSPLYSWFTEGFDTADLKEAKALLDRASCVKHSAAHTPSTQTIAPLGPYSVLSCPTRSELAIRCASNRVC